MTIPLTEADLAAIEAYFDDALVSWKTWDFWGATKGQEDIDALIASNRALLAEVRRLRAALAFYAHRGNYNTSHVFGDGSQVKMASQVDLDNGDTARRALAGEE